MMKQSTEVLVRCRLDMQWICISLDGNFLGCRGPVLYEQAHMNNGLMDVEFDNSLVESVERSSSSQWSVQWPDDDRGCVGQWICESVDGGCCVPVEVVWHS